MRTPILAPTSNVALWLACVCAAACRSGASTEPPGGDEASAHDPASPEPEAVATNAAAPAKTDAAPSPAPPVYGFAWGQTTGDWNNAVAVAPSGWVVSAGSGTLRVHASNDGRVLESRRGCSLADNGLTLSSDAEGIVVCSNGEIKRLILPGLVLETVASVGGHVEAVGWGGGLVATGDDQGQVHVVKTGTWQEVDGFTVPHEIEGVAVAPDGRWVAVGDREGSTFIRELAGKSTRELAHTDRRPTAMAASPDGKQLFVHDGSFEAHVYDVASGAVLAAFECGSWLTGARFIGPELVAATGSDGFVLYAKGAREGHALVDPEAERRASHEWLGASEDGGIVCGGDRDGRVSCFSTKPMAVSSYEPAPVAPTPAAGQPAAAADLTVLMEGTIVAHKGKRLEVLASSGALPAVGTKGALSRRFERTIGRMTMSGWMGIAKVEVMKVTGTTVVLQILEETSNVKINGRKQDQFVKGFEVKLEPGE